MVPAHLHVTHTHTLIALELYVLIIFFSRPTHRTTTTPILGTIPVVPDTYLGRWDGVNNNKKTARVLCDGGLSQTRRAQTRAKARLFHSFLLLSELFSRLCKSCPMSHLLTLCLFTWLLFRDPVIATVLLLEDANRHHSSTGQIYPTPTSPA